MGYWNYRIVEDKNSRQGERFSIRRVHYDDFGNIRVFDSEGIIYSENKEELLHTVNLMADCFAKEVLDYKE